ncbi:MAG: ThuA domain-containing protein [Gammaproteobacteria bacterium]|nr:ThuA domain-containing protein [Gammaproteobacteria bacterium]
MTPDIRTVFFLLAATLLPGSLAHAQIKALLLTSPGIYHDYAYQSQAITSALAGNIHIQFDVSLADTARWQQADFARDYDVIIYNICMADNSDAALIGNLRRQTETLRIPAIVLHCAMHSFRTTDLWWPLHGLHTTAHESIGEIEQQQVVRHPILTGIPSPWRIAHDELYINLAFQGSALLQATGEDGAQHVTAWIHSAGDTRLFGTTLGHSTATIDDPAYQRLLTNAVLWVTGNLNQDGSARTGLAPNSTTPAIGQFLAAPGAAYLTDDDRSCMRWEMGKAVGPCLAGCTLNPLTWGDEADACRAQCFAALPTNAELMARCAP